MARRVYFAFHYQRDVMRVNIVRNSDITKEDREEAGYYDHSLWEEARRTGDGIRRMILNGLENTSVTAFLLGSETHQRPWVKYELEESWKRGNGLVEINVNSIGAVIPIAAGPSILQTYTAKVGDVSHYLSEWFEYHDWKAEDGYSNFGRWVDRSVQLSDWLKARGIMPGGKRV